MTKISILCAKPRNPFLFFSSVIMSVEKTKFSHVAILVYQDFNYWVYESVYPHSRKLLLSEWLKKYEVVFRYDLNPTNVMKMTAVEMDQIDKWFKTLDKNYSLTQLFVIGFQRFTRLSWDMTTRIFGRRRGLICVELVARFLVEFYQVNFSVAVDYVEFQEIIQKVQGLNALNETK